MFSHLGLHFRFDLKDLMRYAKLPENNLGSYWTVVSGAPQTLRVLSVAFFYHSAFSLQITDIAMKMQKQMYFTVMKDDVYSVPSLLLLITVVSVCSVMRIVAKSVALVPHCRIGISWGTVAYFRDSSTSIYVCNNVSLCFKFELCQRTKIEEKEIPWHWFLFTV